MAGGNCVVEIGSEERNLGAFWAGRGERTAGGAHGARATVV